MKSSMIKLGIGALCASSLVAAAWAQSARRTDTRLDRRDVITSKAQRANGDIVAAARDAGMPDLANLIERGDLAGVDLVTLYKDKANGNIKELSSILEEAGLIDRTPVGPQAGSLPKLATEHTMSVSANGRQITGAGCDSCADAGSCPVTDGAPAFAGETALNTFGGIDSTCGSSGDETDEWLAYTATCTGTVTVDTDGIPDDTTLSVHSSDCATQIACDDDGGAGVNSLLTFAATSGNVYHIRVAGWGTGDTLPSYNVNISCAGPSCGDGTVDAGEVCDDGNTADGDCCSADCQVSTGPSNDDCSGRISVTDGSTPFDTTCGTTSPEAGSENFGHDVWYNYTATCDGEITVSTCGAAGDSVLEVHDGCGCGPVGASLGSSDDEFGLGCGNDAQLTFTGVSGNCYKIRVGEWGTGDNSGDLVISCAAGFCGDGTLDGPGGEECDDGNTADGDGCSSTCQIEGCGDGIVQAGEACDDGNTAAGDCCAADCSAATGPSNDDCTTRTPIFDGVTPFDSTCVTSDGPAHVPCTFFGDDGIYQDLWYNYVATCTGTLTVDSCGSGFDTKLALYTGDSAICPPLDTDVLACNDDSGCAGNGSTVTAAVTSGNTYKIRIGGWRDGVPPLSGTAGLGALDISCAGGPATGGCCDGAGACTVETEADCSAATGTYLGDGTDCSAGCPATNTSCADRIVIDCSSGAAQETVNTCAGGPTGSSSCNTSGGGGGLFQSVFYEIVPQGGAVTIRTDLNSVAGDSSYAVFQVDAGDPCNDTLWTEVGCSEDEGTGFNGNITINGLLPSNTYVMQLGSWDDASCGEYTIDVSCSAECGDGSIGVGEECDDGNTVNGDGCDSTCTTEECGNGVVQTGEACDDGNTNENDGCSSLCVVQFGCCVSGGCQVLSAADCSAAGGIANPGSVCDPAIGRTPICVQDQCTFNNGDPFDGSIGGLADQWFTDFTSHATVADDFILRDSTSNPCQINSLRAWFFHFNDNNTVDPNVAWSGIDVVIWANAGTNLPNGSVDDGTPTFVCGGFSGCAAEVFIPAGGFTATALDISNPPDGIVEDFWQIDIPLDIELMKNTRYWLTVRPHMAFGGLGQVAWAHSANKNEFDAAQALGSLFTGGPFPFAAVVPTTDVAFQLNGVKTAVCGNGSIEAGEECDGGGCCTGNCTLEVAGTECRASAGTCDVAEVCDGTSGACPADVVVGAGTECRASAGDCDVAEACDGTSADCPADGFQSGNECRASAGPCDVAESCSGNSADCPADGFDSGTECRASAGACDPAESCDGTSVDCPADALSSGNVCRAAAGVCDVAEACDGTSVDCPGDAVANGTVCRASTGACDPAESCDGMGVTCPADSTINDCISGDGCCLAGCNNNNDSDCPAVCGNNALEAGEDCDDGNTADGDGCAADCTSEFVPNVPTLSQWGMIALMLALGGCIVVVAGRRREVTTR